MSHPSQRRPRMSVRSTRRAASLTRPPDARREVVDDCHLVATLDERIDEVRADEPGSAGDEHAHAAAVADGRVVRHSGEDASMRRSAAAVIVLAATLALAAVLPLAGAKPRGPTAAPGSRSMRERATCCFRSARTSAGRSHR